MIKVPAGVTVKIGKTAIILQKHLPHIMFGAGIGGTVTSVVLACRATLKLSDQLDDMHTNVTAAKTVALTTENGKRNLARAYSENAAIVAKLYTPAVLIGAVSVAALTGSHVALTRRNTALTAAYAGLSQAYGDYRSRVRNDVGVEREFELYHAIKEEAVVNVNGAKTVIKTADPNTWSVYARFFDEASIMWQKNSEMNRIYVQCQQNYLNHLLHSRGHVFLNEAYDALGLERSSAGQVVGWVLDENGDNYIDFGIFEAANSRFLNGTERSILLDFNVDGVIYDKI